MIEKNGRNVWPSAEELFSRLCPHAVQSLREADRIRARTSLAIEADSIILTGEMRVEVDAVIGATKEIAEAPLASLYNRNTLIRYIVMEAIRKHQY